MTDRNATADPLAYAELPLLWMDGEHDDAPAVRAAMEGRPVRCAGCMQPVLPITGAVLACWRRCAEPVSQAALEAVMNHVLALGGGHVFMERCRVSIDNAPLTVPAGGVNLHDCVFDWQIAADGSGEGWSASYHLPDTVAGEGWATFRLDPVTRCLTAETGPGGSITGVDGALLPDGSVLAEVRPYEIGPSGG